MKKLTAVEFLVEGINKLTGLNIANDEPMIIEANKIFKQQIIDAYESRIYDAVENASRYNMDSEQYYNETFKQ